MKNRSKNWRKLYDENWKLCREIVKLRDGFVCQIPNCHQTKKLQLDHVYSRQIKLLFFEPGNLGYLCPTHHAHKSFRKGQWVDMFVRDICKTRQGEAWWSWALSVAQTTCPEFSTIYYQEKINDRLKRDLASLNRNLNANIKEKK